MKRMLIAGALALAAGSPALAADLPPRVAPPPQAPAAYIPVAPPVYNWGGFYIGVNGGWGFGTSNWSDPANLPTTSTGDFNIDGGLVGATLGANFQSGPFVFGAEADIDWADINGNTKATVANPFCILATPTVGAFSTTCNTKDSWLGTFRGRIGYAFDRVLLFADGGLAFGDVQSAVSGPGFNTTYQSNTELGWTAGGGLEYGITQNLTAKVEYLYVSLSKSTCNATASCGFDPFPATTVNDAVKFNTSLVRGGLNYKFGGF